MNRSVRTKRSTALPAAEAPTFEEDYLDIDHWPQRWCIESSDLRVGERILEIFKPFLLHLLDQKLSRRNLLLHREHLNTLGEEVVGRVRYKPRQLRRKNMAPVLRVYLDENGGPILYPPTNSPKQRSFDSTCLKLRSFILDS